MTAKRSTTKHIANVAKNATTTLQAANPESNTSSVPKRRLKTGSYKSFRLQKRIKHHRPNLPNAFKILLESLRLISRHKRLFLGIDIAYGLLTIVLVKGFSSNVNLLQFKEILQDPNSLLTGFRSFVYLIGSSGSGAQANSNIYQGLLTIIISLVLIWALRQVLAGTKITVRDAYYKGMTPFIPFILVLLVIGIQLLPAIIGGFVYGVVLTNNIAVMIIEKVLWTLLFCLLALLSLYMITSSSFALYIVTLPDMTPLRALRSARELVRYRRWIVLRKLLFLPIIIFVLDSLIMIPLILYATPVAEWSFFALSMIGIVVVHSYMYALYRELLRS